MITPKLQHFLDENHVAYKTISHTPAYTAQEIAERAHIPGRELAKTVIIKADGKLIMLVEPAYTKINLKLVKSWLGAKKVELATETEFMDSFPECELGAEPPFGNLYNMEVYLDDWQLGDEKIAFNAGSHDDLIEMSFKDYEKLVKPKKIHAH